MYPFRLLLRDTGISAFLDDLAERELRPYPDHVILGLHEFADLRELQACIAVHGDDVRVHPAADIQQYRAVLATAE